MLGFGLIHGLGLSTRLQDIGVEDNELGKLIAFNVGIELGQLFVVAAVVLLGKLALTFLPDPHRRVAPGRPAERALRAGHGRDHPRRWCS